MSDWIRTKAGLQMAETIIRYLPKLTTLLVEPNIKIQEIEERLFSSNKTMVKYLPRITVALEEIAKNKEYNEEEDVALGSSIVKSNEEVEGVFMSNGEVVNVDYVKEGDIGE